MLSAQQICHFETFGFLCLNDLFTPAEMVAMTSEAEELLEANPGRRSGPSHQAVAPFVEMCPGLARLPEDDRIYRPIEQLLGEGFVWGNSEGVSGSFNETNDHQWHCDRAGQIDLQYTRIKIMIYLQSMRKDAGALRVIPGSHHAPFHQQLLALQSQEYESSPSAFGVEGSELCSCPLEVDPGDVVVFNHYLFHGVYGKQKRRRYIAMKFADAPETRAHYEALRDHGQDASRLADEFRYSERPRIKGMVEKLLAWEEHLAAAG